MADKMLIDASHEEETRVVVVRGNRIEEFDFESQHKKQLRGNIYLAKVTRVEPSLQAAFVEYGGNRHGFLAFSEIHPDYYQIPVADRQALIDAEAEEARAEDDDGDTEKPAKRKTRTRRSRSKSKRDTKAATTGDADTAEASTAEAGEPDTGDDTVKIEITVDDATPAEESTLAAESAPDDATPVSKADDSHPESSADVDAVADTRKEAEADESAGAETDGDGETKKSPPDSIAAAIDADEVSEAVNAKDASGDEPEADDDDEDDENDPIESVGAEDALEEVPDRSRKPRKQYRIQEVIKRRQILLVQVVKEERGNKGAALTTYLSLAGRYSVLMPNTARGGGISRKITNVQDRKRLKEIARGLEVPQGMGVILRTAGANRTKAEIKRDFEYLMRLWENVRNLTLTSTAPCLVYEEGSLIKRSIRDLYNKDIGEVIVSGENGYREAKDFMKMLMPSHAKAVQPYRDVQPIFARSGIEAQLDKMLQPQVTLKSGGYIIINQTEALVAIDVNSGRSTKEHSIEDTALRTNLEAAEEVARQLRLRDMAGLIVIDYIDMEEKRNNRAVEKKLKDCLKSDRARIQVGRISHFGLLEMSRQRIRASVLESTMQVCEQCGGTGYTRSDSSVALFVLRAAEEHLLRNTKHNITVRTMPEIALYLLNQKRDTIVEFESRFGVSITVEADATIGQQHVAIDQGDAVESPVVIDTTVQFDAEIDQIVEEVEDTTSHSRNEEDEGGRKRKRRRRRRGGRGNGENNEHQASGDADGDTRESESGTEPSAEDDGEQRKKRRRRGKRGGKRNRDQESVVSADGETSDTSTKTDEHVSDDSTADAQPDASQISADAATAVEPDDSGHEAPKKRRTRRRKGAADDNASNDPSDAVGAAPDQQAMDTASSDVTHAEQPLEVAAEVADEPKRPRRRRAVAADQPPAEPVITSSSGESEDAADEKPKKAGWWQRRGFF
ncbi:MAG: Rne/Rng family ribonuclease [Alphaproteobacteria bacterium]|nr:Rne/Rng family ribonuclease [Alphaproteobacteria bacterium]